LKNKTENYMLFDELIIDFELTLNLLKLDYTIEKYLTGKLKIYNINKFGVKVYCIRNFLQHELQEASLENSKRTFIISTANDFQEKKESFIWELMKSGYLRWFRLTYPRHFKDLIVTQNFGNKIIKKRLELWDNKDKFKYFIEENLAYKSSLGYALTLNPSFFDVIPEINDLTLEESCLKKMEE